MEINKGVEIFKPGIAELRAIADRYKSLTIQGVEDEAGYLEAKKARKELGDWRIDITKYGKKCREEALAFQREVLRQEKEHLEVITPVEDNLKAMLLEVDEAKKRKEREALLPSRKMLIEEIGLVMTDEQILDLDEKQFSDVYTSAKMEYLERKAKEQRDRELLEQRVKEIEEAKAQAKIEAEAKAKRDAIEAKEKAERDKQEAIDRIKLENEEKERKAKEAEAEKQKAEEAEKARVEKNRRYKDWLKSHGAQDNENFKVERDGNTFILWEKKDSIVIK